MNKAEKTRIAKTPRTILKNFFGYERFLENQEAIIKTVLSGQDCLVVMPTGSGKSLCYQIPAMMMDGLTVVISPLISLMKDQVGQLQENGITALCLNSQLDWEQYNRNIRMISSGHVDLLYLAPETLLLDRTINLLKSIKVNCFAVDEAHCISEWGHDFRPEYRQIAGIREQFDDSVLIALTATATPRVQKDIVNSLEIKGNRKFISSFDRKNLLLNVQPKSEPIEQSIEVIQKFPDESGLIYCFSRKQVDELTDIFDQEGFSVKPYHAGLSKKERQRNQDLFIRDDVNIIVATIAFGMGIDKPDIRYVIHYDFPKNIESYYQQIGRAGRDGLDSYCLLLFGYGDIAKIKYFIQQKEGKQRKIAYRHLDAIVDFCETGTCRRKPLLKYFGEVYEHRNCEMCDNCLGEHEELQDLTVPAQKFMSAIVRTKELYGANHIADILRGSQNQKVLRKGHHKLPTYGIGKDISKKQWLYLSRQMIRKKLVNRDMEYGSLKMRPQGWLVLKSEGKFFGKLQKQKVKRRVKEIDYDDRLYEILKAKRKTLADKANLPPYAIFPDKTLMEMAFYFPLSKANMLKIYGIGQVKAGKYSHEFLPLIENFCQQNGLKSKLSKTRSSRTKRTKKRRFEEVGERFNQNQSFRKLAKDYRVKGKTILKHLYNYLKEGNKLRAGIEAESGLSGKQRREVMAAFRKLGTARLRPVYDHFEEQIDYDELEIMRIAYLTSNQSED